MNQPQAPGSEFSPASGDTEWTWVRGGEAQVAATDGITLTVHSTVAYPPGAPLVANSVTSVTFEMKVRSCRKLPSGQFEITGKLVNATRPLREQLVSALALRSK